MPHAGGSFGRHNRSRGSRQSDPLLAIPQVSQALCIETFKDFDIFGRFMLRDEGITVGMGIVKKLHDIVATA